jgi:cytochrome c oxidase cbb3-type subunit III
MSDFVNEFWNMYVIGIVLVSVIGCAIFLWSQGSSTFTVGQTTGHAWDETLEEYNNPLPKWWSWLFYLTVVFALVYLALFPGLGRFPGVLKWTSVGQWQGEQDKAKQQYEPIFQKYLAMDIPAVAADKNAMEMGKRLFLTYCVQCHGVDAKGSKGFPNLADNDWLYGGEPDKLVETISFGRQGMMPAHKDSLSAETIKDVANYVRSLSGLTHDAVLAAKGKETFDTICAACHTPEGTGNQMIGSPNLTDKTWLYGSSENTIIETITNGRTNRMPAWKDFLGDAKVHLLASYVYSLSHSAQQ